MKISDTTRRQVENLLDFIDASPSPWHAVATCEEHLQAAGFSRLDDADVADRSKQGELGIGKLARKPHGLRLHLGRIG